MVHKSYKPVLQYIYGVFCPFKRLKSPIPIHGNCMEKIAQDILQNENE